MVQIENDRGSIKNLDLHVEIELNGEKNICRRPLIYFGSCSGPHIVSIKALVLLLSEGGVRNLVEKSLTEQVN